MRSSRLLVHKTWENTGAGKHGGGCARRLQCLSGLSGFAGLLTTVLTSLRIKYVLSIYSLNVPVSLPRFAVTSIHVPRRRVDAYFSKTYGKKGATGGLRRGGKQALIVLCIFSLLTYRLSCYTILPAICNKHHHLLEVWVRKSVGRVRPHTKGEFLFVGDEKLYVRGVTYGPFRPTENGSEYHSPDDVERDFAQLAASELNVVRTCTTPPRWLLDARSPPHSPDGPRSRACRS